MRTIFVLLAAQALLVSLAAAKSDRRVLRMNRKLCADCSDDETNSEEENGNDSCMCPERIVIDDVNSYYNSVKDTFTPVGLVGSDPLGTKQYVVIKNGKQCNANPLLEDAYYGDASHENNGAASNRRRMFEEAAEAEGLQIVPGVGSLGASAEVDDGEAGARRVLLGSNNNYCTDATIVNSLKFENVTNCPEFCTDNYCAGKIYWSTFINIDKKQCVRATDEPLDYQCAIKSEAQFQSRTSFKNNDNIEFPSNNKYKGQINAQSVGPQDLTSGSIIKSDLRNLGIRTAKNGIGKVAITWSITTFVPSSTFIADVNAGKYNYFNDNVNNPTNTSSLMYWTKTKKLQLKAGSVYCAAVLNTWRDPSPYRAQSCSPQDPYACRDDSDYLVGDCYSTVPDPNNPGQFLDMCKKQRTAIWIYIPYGNGYVVPVFDTETLADTDYRVPGTSAIAAFRDPCVEPTIIPDVANPSAKGGNPINIVASTFILPDANKQCTAVDNECDPVPPCTCPSPPPPPTPTSPPPPPPAVCPACPACVRRRLSADDLVNSDGNTTWSVKANVLVDLPCTATPYLQSLQLAQTFTEVAYKVLGVPVVADDLTCGPNNQVQIGVKALVGLEGAWNVAESLKGKVLSAFVSTVKGTVSSAISVVDAEPALVDVKLSFVASSGFEDSSASAKPARKRFLF